MAELQHRLDTSTAKYRLLDHPFYVAWVKGTLTLKDLALYAAQYWHHVNAFPGYLMTLAHRLSDSEAKEIVLENLADERDDDHPGLWLRFAEAVGVDRGTVRESEPEQDTVACINTFERAMASADPVFALGMLYGYESQTPEVAKTKVAGLRAHFQLDGDPLVYFELHGRLDVEHSLGLAAAIDQLSTSDADIDKAASGAAAGAAAVWRLLDGVERARGRPTVSSR